MQLDHLVAQYLQNRNLAAASTSSYSMRARVLWTVLDPSLDTGQVTAQDVEAVLHRLRKTPTQANRCAQLLGAAWRWAWRRGLVAERCAVDGVDLHRERPRTRHLTRDELASLLSTARSRLRGTASIDSIAAVILMALTGCRIGEVRSARWSGYDARRGTLTVDGKTGERDVALNDEACQLLNWLRARSPDQLAVVGSGVDWDGAIVRHSASSITKVLASLCEQAGVQRVSPHDLRRSFAILAREAGVPIAHVSAALGHTCLTTTIKYYAQPTVAQSQGCVRAVTDFLARGES
jgi:integrase